VSKRAACLCQTGLFVNVLRGEPGEGRNPARKRAVSSGVARSVARTAGEQAIKSTAARTRATSLVMQILKKRRQTDAPAPDGPPNVVLLGPHSGGIAVLNSVESGCSLSSALSHRVDPERLDRRRSVVQMAFKPSLISPPLRPIDFPGPLRAVATTRIAKVFTMWTSACGPIRRSRRCNIMSEIEG
jgi:hypothetical protein